jgi:hypothetical protein
VLAAQGVTSAHVELDFPKGLAQLLHELLEVWQLVLGPRARAMRSPSVAFRLRVAEIAVSR